MKVLVTGSAGMPGSAVLRELEDRGMQTLGVDAPEFDVTKEAQVRRLVEDTCPDAIIHCAAYTNMDKAESEPAACASANGFGALTMARAAVSVGAERTRSARPCGPARIIGNSAWRTTASAIPPMWPTWRK